MEKSNTFPSGLPRRLLSLRKNKTKKIPAVEDSQPEPSPIEPESPVHDNLPHSKPTSQGTLGAQSIKDMNDKDAGILSIQEIDDATRAMEDVLTTMRSLVWLSDMEAYYTEKLSQDLKHYCDVIRERHHAAAPSQRKSNDHHKHTSRSAAEADDRVRAKCFENAAHFWGKWADNQDDFRRAFYDHYLALNQDAKAFFRERCKANNRQAELTETVRAKIYGQMVQDLPGPSNFAPQSHDHGTNFSGCPVAGPTSGAATGSKECPFGPFNPGDYSFALPNPAAYLEYGRNPGLFQHSGIETNRDASEIRKIHEEINAIYAEKHSCAFRDLEDALVSRVAVAMTNKGFSYFKSNIRKTGNWNGIGGLRYYALQLNNPILSQGSSSSESEGTGSPLDSSPPRPVPDQDILLNDVKEADIERRDVARRQGFIVHEQPAGESREVQHSDDFVLPQNVPIQQNPRKSDNVTTQDSPETGSTSDKSGRSNQKAGFRMAHIAPGAYGLPFPTLAPMNYHTMRADGRSSNETTSSAQQIYSPEHVSLPFQPQSRRVQSGKGKKVNKPAFDSEGQEGNIYRLNDGNPEARGSGLPKSNTQFFSRVSSDDDTSDDDQDKPGTRVTINKPTGRRYDEQKTGSPAAPPTGTPTSISQYERNRGSANTRSYSRDMRSFHGLIDDDAFSMQRIEAINAATRAKCCGNFQCICSLTGNLSTVSLDIAQKTLPQLVTYLSKLSENTEGTTLETSPTSPRVSRHTNVTSVASTNGTSQPYLNGINKKTPLINLSKKSPDLDRRLRDLGKRLSGEAFSPAEALAQLGFKIPEEYMTIEKTENHPNVIASDALDALDGFSDGEIERHRPYLDLPSTNRPRNVPSCMWSHFRVAREPTTSIIYEGSEPDSRLGSRTQQHCDMRKDKPIVQTSNPKELSEEIPRPLFASIDSTSGLKRTGKFCRNEENGQFEVSPPLGGCSPPRNRNKDLSDILQHAEDALASVDGHGPSADHHKRHRRHKTEGQIAPLPKLDINLPEQTHDKGSSISGHVQGRYDTHFDPALVKRAYSEHGLGINGHNYIVDEYARRRNVGRRSCVCGDELEKFLAQFKEKSSKEDTSNEK